MKRRILAAALVVVTALAAMSQQKPRRLDGTWWSSLPEREQVEFLAGYIDCYVNDLGSKGTFVESWYTYAPRISSYYANHPERETRLVTSVLFDIRSRRPPRPPEGGEKWSGKHGFFDGEYWAEMTERARVAFVTGYLSCYHERIKERTTTFSMPPQTYAERISKWFGLNAASSEVNPKRERVAIADALYKFADTRSVK